ncbi:MAG TPA: RNA 2',3'-cyclic phosphodiesterase [Caulobacteraceae bacterium]
MIRLFAAIPLPQEVADAVAHRQYGLAGARWTPRENLHLTLRFAGDVSEPQGADFATELSVVRSPPLGLALSGVGSFSSARDVRKLWAGVEASGPLQLLASRCETAARRSGLTPERRQWRPHVTLAHVKEADASQVAAWIQAHNLMRSSPFQVTSFGLYSSWRAAGGSAYRLERLYPLG